MTIDIHDPITEICHRLGLEPRNVAQIIFRPHDVTATIYKLNSEGAKYVDFQPGQGPGTVATETKTFTVTT